MKQYQTTLTAAQHDFLTKHFEMLVGKAKREPSTYATVGAMIEEILIQFQESEEIVIKEEPSASVKDLYVPNLCKEHPQYKAVQAPTIDCQGHWDAYKKMNPTKYEAARRKFERSRNDRKQQAKG